MMYQILQETGLEMPGQRRIWMAPGQPVQITREAILTIYFDSCCENDEWRYRTFMRLDLASVTIKREWKLSEFAPFLRIRCRVTAIQRAIKITHGRPAGLLIEMAPTATPRSMNTPHPGSGTLR